MKKKIALALSAIMAFASIATVNVFAAPRMSAPASITNYEDGTLIADRALGLSGAALSTPTSLETGVSSLPGFPSSKVGNSGDGTDFLVTFDAADPTADGKSFELELTGATFAFYKAGTDLFTDNTGVQTTYKAVTGAPNLGYFTLSDPTFTGIIRGVDTLLQFQAPAGYVPYDLYVNQNRDSAVITFRGNIANGDVLRVPLVINTTTDGEVKVKVNSSNSGLPANEYTLNKAGSGTTVSIKSVKEGRTSVPLDQITVKENSFGTFKAGKGFKLEAPDGYKFAYTKTDADVLTFDQAYTGNTLQKTGMVYASEAAAAGDVNTYGYFSDSNTVFHVKFSASFKDAKNNASVYISNLSLVPEEDQDIDYGVVLKLALKNEDGGITEKEFDAAKFVDYSITFKRVDDKDPKTFDSGYLGKETAKVSVKENANISWWTSRTTTFTLTDKDGNVLDDALISSVKFKIKNVDNTTLNDKEIEVKNITGQYRQNDYYISNDGHSFTITNAGVLAGKKVEAELTFFISTNINFAGDVYVRMSGDAFPATTGYITDNGIVQVAKVEQKVKVDTRTTTVQVGYLSFDVADITVTELKAGALAKDKRLELSIGQYGTSAISKYTNFWPISSANIIAKTGDISISAVKASGGTTTIGIDITKTSKTASTFTLGQLKVDLDRGVPNGSFELTVAGDALMDNSSNINGDKKLSDTGYKRDTFDNVGLVVPKYIIVGTEGVNVAFTREIRIYQESANVLVDNKEQALECPTVNVDGRLYVPLRFVSQVLGAGAQDVIFDPVTRNIQITLNNKTVTWTDGSEYYVSGGVKMAMAEDGVISKCFISDRDDSTWGRTFIPFRYLAYAFSIPVDYDEATGAAIYNKQAANVSTATTSTTATTAE